MSPVTPLLPLPHSEKYADLWKVVCVYVFTWFVFYATLQTIMRTTTTTKMSMQEVSFEDTLLEKCDF